MKLKSYLILAAVVSQCCLLHRSPLLRIWPADGGPAFILLKRIETIVYGAPQGGRPSFQAQHCGKGCFREVNLPAA
jgi:hypothetical protein